MGILMNMIDKIKESKFLKEQNEMNNAYEDKNCLRGNINIFKTREPDVYTISIDCSQIFPSKEKLYEYYLALYKSFEEHFKQVVGWQEIFYHECTYEGEKVTLSESGGYYGINEVLRFTDSMINCRDWFYETLQNLYKVCFN